MERYYELGNDTIQKIDEYISKFSSSPYRLEYAFIGDNKLKDLLKITKINDTFLFITKKQVLITVNESIWDVLDESDIEILVREQINMLIVDLDSGKIKIEKPTFNSSKSIIEKYSFEEVMRVKELVKLTLQQAEEKTNEMDISK